MHREIVSLCILAKANRLVLHYRMDRFGRSLFAEVFAVDVDDLYLE